MPMDCLIMEAKFSEIFEKALVLDNTGKVADYIPQLGKVNPDLLGLSICDMSGKIFNFGDYDIDFCLQSCSKPLTYCIAREKYGAEHVHEHVGYEPSGLAFNAHVLNKDRLPHNPLINAGAIMVSSLIAPEEEPAERYEMVIDYYRKMSGNMGKIGFDASVFLSEKQHADRNISLAYFMREVGAFKSKLDHNQMMNNLNLYFQSCSVTINCKIGSIIAATLANGGTCPITGEKIFSTETVRDCLTLMYGCGMYDLSGQFSFQVGLPAKSGVSGCVLLVMPGKYGICSYSPPLDPETGNSVKGIYICQEVSKSLNAHIFHNMVSNLDVNPEWHLQKLIKAAADGDLETVKCMATKVDYNDCDYDKRTALHLAAAEGHSEIVLYLLSKHVDPHVKDRWGNTPLSEATSHNKFDVVEILKPLSTLSNSSVSVSTTSPIK